MQLTSVDPEFPIHLRDEDAITDNVPPDKQLKQKLRKRLRRIAKLQARLYGDGRYALLVVLQGRDTAGKDGTIRSVFSACNPQGCDVMSFKEPTPFELRHDFLWRIHQAVPPHGMIGIFNRSHYEDVIAVRVHDLVPKHVWQRRYDQINAFEHMLVENRVIMLKFFLHISRPEQRKRLRKRVERPAKNWKFRMADIDDRKLWDGYSDAYQDALRYCSTSHAPWYIVPADNKHVRNYLIAQTIVDTLEQLELRYPEADPNVLLHAEQLLDV